MNRNLMNRNLMNPMNLMNLMNRRALRFALAALVVAGYVRFGPLPDGLLEPRGGESIEVLDRNGELLYEARAGDGTRSSWLAADQLPPTLIAAT